LVELPNPPIVIDTCSFRDKGFINKLGTYHGRKVISAVTYAEMQVYLIYDKNKEESYFDKILYEAGIEIQDYSRKQGLLTAILGGQMGDFHSKFNDYSIASHAYDPPWLVVTYNERHFSYLNDRVKSPMDFIKQYM
jgi:predicted nucleic acid-binding protein